MPNPTAQYPFDPTGQAGTNLIANENQILTPPDWSDFYFIVPTATPFFANDKFKAVLKPSNKVLQEGVDFNFTHQFYDASKQSAAPVYGSITFLDRTLTGIIELTYQTLGGDWTLNSSQIANLLANVLMNPRTTTWEEVVDVPYQFPPIDHAWDVKDMTGMGNVTDAINQIVVALEATSDITLTQHLSDFNNPHKVNAFQVGLGKVNNWPIATDQQAEAGAAADAYMTPELVAKAITTQAISKLNLHKEDDLNPHHVTKEQVGLGKVENLPLATSADAIDGSSNYKYMTPSTTSVMIANLSGQSITSHLADFNNPHKVTKEQIGLTNIKDYPIATEAQALNGVSNEAYMTPSTVAAVIDSKFNSTIIPHLNDTDNPHNVTKEQIGLDQVENLPIATEEEAEAGEVDTAYLTPQDLTRYFDSNFVSYFNNQALALSKTLYGFSKVLPTSAKPPEDDDDPESVSLRKYAYFFDGPTWTMLLDGNKTFHTFPTVLLVSGGKDPQDTNQPTYLVKVNLRNNKDYEIKQISGESDGFIKFYFGTGEQHVIDNGIDDPITIPPSNSLFMYCDDQRGAIEVNVLLDIYNAAVVPNPNGANSGKLIVSNTDPGAELWQNRKYTTQELEIIERDDDKLNKPSMNGNSKQTISIHNDVSDLSYYDNFTDVSPIKHLNIIEEDYTGLNFWQSKVEYGNEIHYMDRISSYNYKPLLAKNRNVWSWDGTNDVFVADNVNKTLQTLLMSDPVFSDEYVIEATLKSSSNSGHSLGLCLGYFDYNGEIVSLYAMRTPGEDIVDARNGDIINHSDLGLFTIGFNLFQHDNTVIALQNKGLKWGDGVSGDSERDLDTSPFDTGNTANGWNGNGFVKIRFTLKNGVATFETTNFNSNSYVNDAKVTLDLTSDEDGELFAKGQLVGGYRWGLANFNQDNSQYEIKDAPDMYPRFVHHEVNVDGSDNSIMHAYVGDISLKDNGWTTTSALSLPPGQIIKNPYANSIWMTRKDSTLEELFPNLNGQSILTT